MVRNRKQLKGFSLIELVIVVVIIGIIAAIAIPRMSRGSQGAADSALKGDLSVLRSAVDLYKAEHNAYPDGTNVTAQLTGFTDANGNPGSQDSTHIYGPYLRTIPVIPVGTLKGNTTTGNKIGGPPPGTPDAGYGWLYDPTTGNMTANTAAQDATGTAYSTY